MTELKDIIFTGLAAFIGTLSALALVARIIRANNKKDK
jgi:hypothetical protein